RVVGEAAYRLCPNKRIDAAAIGGDAPVIVDRNGTRDHIALIELDALREIGEANSQSLTARIGEPGCIVGQAADGQVVDLGNDAGVGSGRAAVIVNLYAA